MISLVLGEPAPARKPRSRLNLGAPPAAGVPSPEASANLAQDTANRPQADDDSASGERAQGAPVSTLIVTDESAAPAIDATEAAGNGGERLAKASPARKRRRVRAGEHGRLGGAGTHTSSDGLEVSTGSSIAPSSDLVGRVEARPIGTTRGLRELAELHKRAAQGLGASERRVHMLLWPLALHFGLYWIRPGRENERPPLIGAFWARSLAEAPLTMGHLFPASLFRGLYAGDVWEFGGMTIDPEFTAAAALRMLSHTVRLFLFSRRPGLVIATPVEPLRTIYESFGLKTVDPRPVEHPHVPGVRVNLMYGRFRDLVQPYFM